MFEIISKPFRVYLILGSLAILGVLCGWNLPISLFPSSSQVRVSAQVPFGSLSANHFFDIYGNSIEAAIKKIKIDNAVVDKVTAEYNNQTAHYRIWFSWGADPDRAIKEVENQIHNLTTNMDEGVRRGIDVWSWRDNQGFYALSFYSPLRSLDEIYDLIKPKLAPLNSRVLDAERISLFNPNQKDITITLNPEKLAQFELTTYQVQAAIQKSLQGYNGGQIRIAESYYPIELEKSIFTAPGKNFSLQDVSQQMTEKINHIRVSNGNRNSFDLKDFAEVRIERSQQSQQIFKTSGVESLILFASPKEGGNIKAMSDEISMGVEQLVKELPKDIEYKVLVNPADFINNSIQSVVHEVFVAAFLAVIVLFLFIGNLKNVITAAIEIPLSLLLAFILMKVFKMNLNLISLGGLALSAGMNVDASVVVLENIFRHFKENTRLGALTYHDKASLIVKAVKEVQLPIIASTIASLVVFFPLIFTNGLTNSILGDLAKAVIFSHGLSAIVALVLVPTIRLHLVKNSEFKESHSYFEPFFVKIENLYQNLLTAFIKNIFVHRMVMLGAILLLGILVSFVIPQLKTEVIGKPDSDWLIVGVNSPSFSSAKELDSELNQVEQQILEMYPNQVAYTFTQINGSSNGFIMVKIKDKKKIESLITQTEAHFKNTPTKFYWVDAWNPSELSIPEPPNFRVEITGGNPMNRWQVAHDLQNEILLSQSFEKVNVTPSSDLKNSILIKEKNVVGGTQEVLSQAEISHLLRVASDGVYTDRWVEDKYEYPMTLQMDKKRFNSVESLQSLPVGFEGKIVPLSALVDFELRPTPPNKFREDQRELTILTGTLTRAQKSEAKARVLAVEELIQKFQVKQNGVSVQKVAPDKEITEAVRQLIIAISISMLLVFFTMVFQLGDVIQTLLVLVAIPAGFIGVVLSLWMFRSSLSLNSGLGTILLNGIAVANSIILVDFIHKKFQLGLKALDATVEASVARLRPILMTSLTTILGMLPMALGFGEGGKILQPLGIAVAGGLWISMLLTLFFVPTLQYLYLKRREKL